jgi:A/G-specific adenine glycosylase
MNLPFSPAEVSNRLLAWYSKEGRALPWRENRDPYRIWLSEIMLQQTTVVAVIPYYERFLQRFPTVETLASASLDDVISMWAGLGYYSRARNLHRAAQQIVSKQGVFPETLEGLLELPGVGRSTAGAILSIAFDQPAPILDGNVRRVLVRLFAWQEDPRSSRAEKQLWQWAEALTPNQHPHDYAQAIMDLGATVCVPRKPVCNSCPLQELCQARKEGLAEQLPVARKQKKIPVRQQIALLIKRSGSLLLRQRPPEGFLGGLWEFPAVELSTDQQPRQAAERLLADLGLSGALSEVGEVRHAYSHFKLDLSVFEVEIDLVEAVAEEDPYRWFAREEMGGLPLHGAHRKVSDQFENTC